MALSMMVGMLNQGPKEQICLILNQVTWFDVLRPGINSYCDLYDATKCIPGQGFPEG